jgi:TolB-like protein/Flp pilus assembly protein TadD
MSRFRRLLREVHQRSLWQALVVYLGASYAVLEAVDLFSGRYGLPAWLFSVAALLLLLGLPLVVVSTLTREEVYADAVPAEQQAAADAEDQRLRRLTWRSAGLALLGALAVWGVVAAGWLAVGGDLPRPRAGRVTLAVLPFLNMSGDTAREYFAVGITDEITTQLAKIYGLEVTSRTTADRYRGSEKSLREIAEELGVDVVVEGGAQPLGDRVRISAQLIDASTDAHLWAESYDRSLADIFAIQTDIAQRIALALQVTLTPNAKRRIEREPTQDPEAYTLYLRGIAFYRDHPFLSVDLLQRAVELDPNFALAYSRLANAHGYLYMTGADPTRERADMAREAMTRALELEPDDPDFIWNLSYHYYQVDKDYDRALETLSRVKDVDPDNPNYDYQVAMIFRRLGRFPEAAALVEAAFNQNRRPRSAEIVGSLHRWMREYEEAERWFDRALELDPTLRYSYSEKARLYLLWEADTARAHAVLEAQCENLGIAFPRTSWYLITVLGSYYRDAVIRAESPASLGQRPGYEYDMMKGVAYQQAGLPETSRAYFDSARAIAQGFVDSEPANASNHAMLGLAQAYLGNRDEAIREGRMAARLLTPSMDAVDGPALLDDLARIYALVGERDAAIDVLEELLVMEGPQLAATPAWLRVDPMFVSLRGHPRFEALLAREP